jgi:hypothetical protein
MPSARHAGLTRRTSVTTQLAARMRQAGTPAVADISAAYASRA